MSAREIFTPDQVAEYMQINLVTIYKNIKEGRLLAFKIGKQYRITAESINLFIAENSTPRGIQLRKFSNEQIDEFLNLDGVDIKVAEKQEKFI
jgi:excisionase family DNA binding protein